MDGRLRETIGSVCEARGEITSQKGFEGREACRQKPVSPRGEITRRRRKQCGWNGKLTPGCCHLFQTVVRLAQQSVHDIRHKRIKGRGGDIEGLSIVLFSSALVRAFIKYC